MWKSLGNQYRSTLDAMDSSASLQVTLEGQSDDLVQKADVVVRLYEATSTAKVNRLRIIQVVFLVFAMLLLAVGAWMTRRSLLKPLDDLVLAAKINEVSREISSRLDIQQVLNSVTEKARTLLGGEVASLCLVDENQHWLKLQTLSGPKHAVVGNTMRADNQFANAVLESDGAMICGVDACRGGCRMLSDEYRTSHLAAPLRIGDRDRCVVCGKPRAKSIRC
ncbi:MAG: hypothetical protein IPL71_03960 [Anaerolineales bacterium]|uniref:hypothetical protein n=1 Tax=Candidatus Villigracilis proximus TaxID=3140683 RepID=UPI003135397A|nr:hypothetical protein [Anaerolineales bacterium]